MFNACTNDINFGVTLAVIIFLLTPRWFDGQWHWYTRETINKINWLIENSKSEWLSTEVISHIAMHDVSLASTNMPCAYWENLEQWIENIENYTEMDRQNWKILFYFNFYLFIVGLKYRPSPNHILHFTHISFRINAIPMSHFGPRSDFGLGTLTENTWQTFFFLTNTRFFFRVL